MIIVLTSLGLTTNDLNSTLDPTGSKPTISFMTVGQTTTANSLNMDYSMHGNDFMYANTKPTTSSPTHTDSSDETDLKRDISAA
jgi:hypothetical protein